MNYGTRVNSAAFLRQTLFVSRVGSLVVVGLSMGVQEFYSYIRHVLGLIAGLTWLIIMWLIYFGE